MDTTRCVDRDIRFWKGDKTNTDSCGIDSSSLCCILKEKIEVPIVILNDEKVYHLLDSCLTDTALMNHTQFPDSSGYFVELFVFEMYDSLKLGLKVRPYSNYYMADVLSNFRNDVYYEWYGYKAKELWGCFFLNNVLCVISSQGWVDKKRASCLFSLTESALMLALFSPIITKVSKHIQSTYYSCLLNCD